MNKECAVCPDQYFPKLHFVLCPHTGNGNIPKTTWCRASCRPIPVTFIGRRQHTDSLAKKLRKLRIVIDHSNFLRCRHSPLADASDARICNTSWDLQSAALANFFIESRGPLFSLPLARWGGLTVENPIKC